MQLLRSLAFALLLAALVAGCGSGGNQLEVTAGDLYFSDDGTRSDESDLTFSATAGTVEIALENEGAVLHNVVVEEAGDTKVAEAEAGASDTGTIDLDAGSYTLYCDVEGHREAGMEATLQVEG